MAGATEFCLLLCPTLSLASIVSFTYALRTTHCDLTVPAWLPQELPFRSSPRTTLHLLCLNTYNSPSSNFYSDIYQFNYTTFFEMGKGLLFRWEDSPALQHHCGFCDRPLSHPGARTSCFGPHSEPCHRFHQVSLTFRVLKQLSKDLGNVHARSRPYLQLLQHH